MHDMDTERALFEFLARRIDAATSKLLQAPPTRPPWTSTPLALERVRAAVKAAGVESDLERLVHELMRGFAHNLLALMDGAFDLEHGEIVLVADGIVLGDGLHERFFAYLDETGRLPERESSAVDQMFPPTEPTS